MLLDVQSYLEKTKILPRRSRLIVAVSGGIDSVSLLDILVRLQQAWGWQLIVAHFDHKVRSDSHEDALFVSCLAEKYKLPFRLGQLEPNKLNQASLRQKRYEFLESIRVGENADIIVTAHNHDDQIETAMLNIIRGADRDGILALKPVRGKIARPLLHWSRGHILVYATSQNLSYREDPSNIDPKYRRNLLRHHVLAPAAVSDPHYRTNFVSRLATLEQLNKKINYGLDRLVDEICEYKNDNQIVLSRAKFLGLSDVVAVNLFLYVVKNLVPSVTLTNANIDVGLDFLKKAKTGAGRMLCSGLKISRSYDTLVISHESGVRAVSKPIATQLLRLGGSVEFGDFVINLSTHKLDGLDVATLQPMEVYVRSRQSGDRIYPVGMTGSRKLQDVFVDAKIPREKRDNWPVVVNRANQVVWLPNLARDRRFGSHDGNKICISAERIERI